MRSPRQRSFCRVMFYEALINLNFFCNNNTCASIEKNELLYKDESHIKPWAAKNMRLLLMNLSYTNRMI
jgi:hypothetical protein